MNIWQLLQTSASRSTNVMGNQNTYIHAKIIAQMEDALFVIQRGAATSKAFISGDVQIGKEYIFKMTAEERGTVLTPIQSVPPIKAGENSTKEPHNDLNAVKNVNSKSASELIQLATSPIKTFEKINSSAFSTLATTIDKLPQQKKEVAIEFVNQVIQRGGMSGEGNTLSKIVIGLFEEKSTMDLVNKVYQSLQQQENPTPKQEKLLETLQQLQSTATLGKNEATLQLVKKAVTLLGLDYENKISELLRQSQSLSTIKPEQLKPLLMDFLQHVTTAEEKSTINGLLSKITGFQLLSREEGNLQQLFIPIPILLDDEAKDWYIHISAKKKNNTVDPEYCRIVMLLDLPKFSTVMIDVFIQKKVINLSFHHSYPPLENLVENSTSSLKKALNDKGYTLSSVKAHFNNEIETASPEMDFFRIVLTSPEKGLDIKI
ncbi:hypothetical protein [Sutcliffiella rhizosphaerae]|uniref:Flagellar hook-length control protein FliK n=1 Tax=Sutcliffiella rhizosphaerae TaxID=2880967 RepID=A0ABM8YIM0_9BACI|nr:hypothetical protein [Sutcliffiella rhizosphaerae]CAG9619727.1 hypothetical protein BACCIP111883_00495 [Sutcliffiella rhizosphaerae]